MAVAEAERSYLLYVVPLLLMLGGLLAASSLGIARRSRVADVIAAVAPYRSLIGAALLFCGLWRIAWLAPGLVSALIHTPVFATVDLVGVVCAVVLGVMLGALALGAQGERVGRALAPAQPVVGVIAMLSGAAWLAIIWGAIPNTI